MLTRRSFIVTATTATGLAAGAAASTCVVPAPKDGVHNVLMLNAACGDAQTPNVFEPPILRVVPGDVVKFIATDSGHNAASKRGMIPDGAEAWNGAIDEELEVKLTVPGIYGYICLPHYEQGMIGLIVVGDDLSNLDAIKKVRHPGQARAAFRELIAELEA